MIKKTQLILAVILFLLCGADSALATDCSDTVTTGISQAECEALVAIYNSTDGPGWTNNNGWTVTDIPCDWHGVTCGSGHVSELDLRGNQLNGPLPSELGDLTWVTQLLLRENQLTHF